MERHRMVAILPCRDLDLSEAFYAELGLRCTANYGDYRLLADGLGAELHLRQAAEEWLGTERNPNGIYLYAEDVDGLAQKMGARVIGKLEEKPWGMLEFAVSDPDEALVRVGRVIA